MQRQLKGILMIVLSFVLAFAMAAFAVSCNILADAPIESSSEPTSTEESASESEKEPEPEPEPDTPEEAFTTVDVYDEYGEEIIGVKITGYEYAETAKLTIPEEIASYPVVAIADEVFVAETCPTCGAKLNYLMDVTEIVFKTTALEEIGAGNFVGMSAVTSIVVPETVKTIGKNCFNGLTSASEVILPAASEIDMRGTSFAECPSLQTVILGEVKGVFGTDTFKSSKAGIEITSAATANLWKIVTAKVTENLTDAVVVYNNGAAIEQDGNGVEYALTPDGAGYALVGFYDTAKAGEPLAPVAGFTIPDTFNGKPITKVGGAVFNSTAYANEEVAAWIAAMQALVVPNAYTTNVTYLGDYNIVGMTALVQVRLPAEITNEWLIGCFVDFAPGNLFRIPRGVKILEDCLSWNATAWFNGAQSNWLIIPSTIEKFVGACWMYNPQSANAAFFTLIDIEDAKSRDYYADLIANSEITTQTWPASRDLFSQFIGAQFVCGAGGVFPGVLLSPNGNAMTYDVVITDWGF